MFIRFSFQNHVSGHYVIYTWNKINLLTNQIKTLRNNILKTALEPIDLFKARGGKEAVHIYLMKSLMDKIEFKK